MERSDEKMEINGWRWIDFSERRMSEVLQN